MGQKCCRLDETNAQVVNVGPISPRSSLVQRAQCVEQEEEKKEPRDEAHRVQKSNDSEIDTNLANLRRFRVQRDILTLNVGGHIFKISSKFLADSGSPVFSALLDAGPGPDNEYFLDRDGTHYRYIMNFLRDGRDKFLIPRNPSVRSEIEHESRFLGLSTLTSLVEARHSFVCPSDLTWPGETGSAPTLLDSLHGSVAGIDGENGKKYIGAPLPSNEAERLHRLESLNILHTRRDEPRFDNITRIVAALFDAPIALVSLVHERTQWFKSHVGLDVCSTCRRSSFCAHMFLPESIFEASMFVVEDCTLDPKFMANPLVVGAPNIRFYAGCPLVTSDGIRLGAICVIDRKPRKISPARAQCLSNFAGIVSQEIERQELTGSRVLAPMKLVEGAPLVPLDFAGGRARRERMRAALDEAVLLVKVQFDCLSWPVLFANEGWTSITSISVSSSPTLSSEVIASGPGLAFATDGSTSCTDPMLWDWLMLSPNESAQLQSMLKELSLIDNPSMFHVSATIRLRSQCGPGSGHTKVSCRFLPACLPMDMNVSAIRVVPAQEANSNANLVLCADLGCYYFVTVCFDGH